MRCFSASQTVRISCISLSVSSSLSKLSFRMVSVSLLSEVFMRSEMHYVCLMIKLSRSLVGTLHLAALRAYTSCYLVIRSSFSVNWVSKAYLKMYFIDNISN